MRMVYKYTSISVLHGANRPNACVGLVKEVLADDGSYTHWFIKHNIAIKSLKPSLTATAAIILEFFSSGIQDFTLPGTDS